jgi:putative peptide zinc metalloprotease protein
MEMNDSSQDPEEKRAGGLWEALEAAVEQEKAPTFDLWAAARERLDPSKRKPKRSAHVEVNYHQTSRGEEYHILRNPEANTYLKLDVRDYFLWELMDGEHSVRDMAVAYFAQYGAFPFERLTNLSGQLRGKGLLEEKPVHIFGVVAQHFAARAWVYRLKRFSETFTQKELSLKNMDHFFELLYRWGGWVFFTRPALALQAIVFLAGLIFFGRGLAAGTYSLIEIGESYGLGLLALIMLIGFMIVSHECGHALAVKHYGRKVLRGGFLVYYGKPVFFVDTTDIWMAPRRARLAVSFAGPWITLLLGSLCSILIVIFTGPVLNSLLFKFSFICYVGALLNATPLLELDGYYMLMDWLELPLLRKKSLDFVKKRLWERLFRERSRFSREERIYAVFGLLSVVSTGFYIFLGVYLWQTNIGTMIGKLRSGQDLLSTVLMVGLLILLGTPFVVGLILRIAFLMSKGYLQLRDVCRNIFGRHA